MDNDISYADYQVDLGPPPGGMDAPEGDTLHVLQWVIDRLEVVAGILRINFFNLNRATFQTLAVICPALAPVKLNLMGIRHIIQVASRRLIMNDNVVSCNNQLINKLGDAVTAAELMAFVYHQGHVRPPQASPYTDFRNLL